MQVAPSQSLPLISVVLCTRNRAKTLSACLAALACLVLDVPFELVIVDNGSTDNTAAILAAFALAQAGLVMLINEPRMGVSRAKNAGIQAARGNIIVFTDDDCYPTPDYLIAVMRCFQDDRIAYLGGRILLHDPADLPITIQPLDHPVFLPANSYLQPGVIHGANFAFRRQVFERVGAFDVHLGPGTRVKGAEDIDLLQRACTAGFCGLYSPEPTVYHHHRRKSAADEAHILKSYAIGRGAYFLKGITNRQSRRVYVYPILKRICGHLVYLRFAEFFHEIQGAMLYWRACHPK
jgi:hypothetical protein